MSKPVIISGSSNRPLAYRVARALGQDLAPVEIRKFPDGEKYVRIDADVSGKDVVIVQSMSTFPDEYIIETLLLGSAAKDAGARSLTLAAPYFAYARQDERFKPGEPVSVAVVGELLNSVGFNGLITVDVHRHRVLDFAKVFRGTWVDVSVMPGLARQAIADGVIDRDAVVLGPDAEAEQWAKIAAEAIGARSYGALKKRRLGDREVEIYADMDLKGKNVFIFDDMISTGGTIIEASKKIRELGGKVRGVACAHGLFVEDALYRIYLNGVDYVISSDTVPNRTTRVSSAEALSEGISKVLKGGAVG